MIKKLAHVGIAVRDLAAARDVFSRLFTGVESSTEEVADQLVRIAFFHIGAASVELTEAASPDSPIAKFIEKRGEGVHHLSFEVDDIRAEIKRLRESGFQMIDTEPRKGAGGYWIAFVHPRSTNGVLVEISQKIRP